MPDSAFMVAPGRVSIIGGTLDRGRTRSGIAISTVDREHYGQVTGCFFSGSLHRCLCAAAMRFPPGDVFRTAAVMTQEPEKKKEREKRRPCEKVGCCPDAAGGGDMKARLRVCGRLVRTACHGSTWWWLLHPSLCDALFPPDPVLLAVWCHVAPQDQFVQVKPQGYCFLPLPQYRHFRISSRRPIPSA